MNVKLLKVMLSLIIMLISSCFISINASADWVKTGDNEYAYENEDGKYVTGIVEIAGKSYYFDKKGKMRTNVWITKKTGEKYYFKNDGTMATGWLKLSKGYYYFKKNGQMMKSQWLTFKGNQYYLRKNGVMATVRIKLNGKAYQFSGSGKLINVEEPMNGLKYEMTKSEVVSKLGLKKGEYHESVSTLYVLPTSKKENENIVLYFYIFTDKKLSAYGKIGTYSKETLNYLKKDLDNDSWEEYTSTSYDKADNEKIVFYKKYEKRAIITVKDDLVILAISQ